MVSSNNNKSSCSIIVTLITGLLLAITVPNDIVVVPVKAQSSTSTTTTTTATTTNSSSSSPGAAQPIPLDGTGVFNLCYFYFAGIDDFGWTFSYNNGRMAAHQMLQSNFSGNLTVTSRYEQGVAFKTIPQRQQLFLSSVALGCRVFLTNSQLLLGFEDDYLATNFTNITFILYDDVVETQQRYSNLIHVYLLHAGSHFVAGATAARVTKTGKIAFLSPWQDPNDAVNGFMLGARSYNSSVEIHVTTMNSWFSPGPEVEAATAFLDLIGCDVIGRYTDGPFVDNLLAARGAAAAENSLAGSSSHLFSIGPHVRLAEYVGDSILVAPYENWENMLAPLLAETILYGNPLPRATQPAFFGIDDGSVKLSPLSTALQAEHQAAFDGILANATDRVFCGFDLKTIGGEFVVPRNSTDGCRDPTERLSTYLDVGQVDHGNFRSTALCPAGTAGSIRMNSSTTPERVFALYCDPCPEDTFSAESGSKSCTPCGNRSFTDGETGSTFCVPVPAPNQQVNGGGSDGELSDVTILILVVIGVVIVFLLVIAVVVALARSAKASKRNKHAVTEAPLCLIFTDVESSTRLWSSYPEAMNEAINLHHQIVRDVIQMHQVYEVKVIGDAFMIATSSVLEAAMVCIDIQTALNDCTKWPLEFGAIKGVESSVWNGLLVRIGIHWCTDVVLKYDHLHQFYDYYGPSVNAAARISGLARGGEILLSDGTLDVLKADDPVLYQVMVEGAASVKYDMATDVKLRGIEHEDYRIHSLVPKKLKDRTFPPLQPSMDTSVSAKPHMLLAASRAESVEVTSDVGGGGFLNSSSAPVTSRSGGTSSGGGSAALESQDLTNLMVLGHLNGGGGGTPSILTPNNQSYPLQQQPPLSSKASTVSHKSPNFVPSHFQQPQQHYSETSSNVSTIHEPDFDIALVRQVIQALIAPTGLGGGGGRRLLSSGDNGGEEGDSSSSGNNNNHHPSSPNSESNARKRNQLVKAMMKYHAIDFSTQGYSRSVGLLSVHIFRELKAAAAINPLRKVVHPSPRPSAAITATGLTTSSTPPHSNSHHQQSSAYNPLLALASPSFGGDGSATTTFQHHQQQHQPSAASSSSGVVGTAATTTSATIVPILAEPPNAIRPRVGTAGEGEGKREAVDDQQNANDKDTTTATTHIIHTGCDDQHLPLGSTTSSQQQQQHQQQVESHSLRKRVSIDGWTGTTQVDRVQARRGSVHSTATSTGVVPPPPSSFFS